MNIDDITTNKTKLTNENIKLYQVQGIYNTNDANIVFIGNGGIHEIENEDYKYLIYENKEHNLKIYSCVLNIKEGETRLMYDMLCMRTDKDEFKYSYIPNMEQSFNIIKNGKIIYKVNKYMGNDKLITEMLQICIKHI